jgi:hypothetical protein
MPVVFPPLINRLIIVCIFDCHSREGGNPPFDRLRDDIGCHGELVRPGEAAEEDRTMDARLKISGMTDKGENL